MNCWWPKKCLKFWYFFFFKIHVTVEFYQKMLDKVTNKDNSWIYLNTFEDDNYSRSR